MNNTLHVFCCRADQVHDVAAFQLFLLQPRQLLSVLDDKLFLLLDATPLLVKQSLLLFNFSSPHHPSLFNLNFSLLFSLCQTLPILLLLFLHPIQLGVLRPQLLQFLLLLTLFSFPLKHELSVLILALSENLLREYSVSFTRLCLRLDPPVHLRLLLFHLIELVFDVLVLTLRGKLLLLDFQLMSKHLVLTPRFSSLLLPSLHAITLTM